MFTDTYIYSISVSSVYIYVAKMLHFVAMVLQVCCIATKLVLFYHFSLFEMI